MLERRPAPSPRLKGLDERQYIEQVEVRVRAVRAASKAWLQTLKLSNNALCNLSTAMTDLTAMVNPDKAEGEQTTLLETNTALVDLSNRLTGMVADSLESKSDGLEKSMFSGMDELIKRIEYINRKGSIKMKNEKQKQDHYLRKIKKMRRKYVLKESVFSSTTASSLLGLNSFSRKRTEKELEKQIARNEVKLQYAQRRYSLLCQRNSQAIQSTVALCDQFFEPCFKQLIMYLVFYYKSVAGAFDELGSTLATGVDSKPVIVWNQDSKTRDRAAGGPPSSTEGFSTANHRSSGDAAERSRSSSAGSDELEVGRSFETPPNVRRPRKQAVDGDDTIAPQLPAVLAEDPTKSIDRRTPLQQPPVPPPLASPTYNPVTMDDPPESPENLPEEEEVRETENTDIRREASATPSKGEGAVEEDDIAEDVEEFGQDRPYTLLGRLGEGSFGTTSLVMDERNNELYVIKRVVCASVEQANEALDEARTLSKFDKSENIVTLHDFFLDVRSKSRSLSVCLVMEYVSGGDLADRLEMFSGRVMPQAEVLHVLRQLLQGLALVHSKNFLHRDLKPANILLDEAGAVKLCDFGVASLLDCSGLQTMIGTPMYMAPEIGTGAYGKAADIWSVGCVLYEMCLMQRPEFSMISLGEVCDAVARRGYEAGVLSILKSCLARDPLQRSTALELLRMVEELATS